VVHVVQTELKFIFSNYYLLQINIFDQ